MKEKCKNGKVKYRTEKDANRARMYILSHDPSAGMFDLMPYMCPECGFFHVGHRSKYLRALSRAAASAGSVETGDNPPSHR